MRKKCFVRDDMEKIVKKFILRAQIVILSQNSSLWSFLSFKASAIYNFSHSKMLFFKLKQTSWLSEKSQVLIHYLLSLRILRRFEGSRSPVSAQMSTAAAEWRRYSNILRFPIISVSLDWANIFQSNKSAKEN